MAQPLPYERDYDFEFFQSQHPATPLPGDKVNLELDQVAETIDQVLDRIARLQRDDLALASKSVGYDQLKDEVSLGFNPPTAWATATAYIRSDSVFANNGFYRCLVSHTSGDFAADLAVGKWQLVADFTSATTAAQVAQAAAETARDAAVVAKNGAESARDTAIGASAAAGTSADNAALSAGTATSAAGTATGARDAALAAQAGAESAHDAAVVARNDAQAAAAAADASADAAAISEANAAATLASALVKTNDLSDVSNPTLAAGNIKLIERDTVALLLADTILAYAPATGKTVVATGQIVKAGGFRYQVAASGASDQHVATAGGVKLYVLPAGGQINIQAFGAVPDYNPTTKTGTRVDLLFNKMITLCIAGPYTAVIQGAYYSQGGMKITAPVRIEADCQIWCDNSIDATALEIGTAGVQFNTSGNGDALLIGDRFVLRKVRDSNNKPAWWTNSGDTSVGSLEHSLVNAIFTGFRVDGFGKNRVWEATNTAYATNENYGCQCTNGLNNIKADISGTGYVNENKWYSGLITNAPGPDSGPLALIESIALYTAETNKPNNNQFIGVNMEDSTSPIVFKTNGIYNLFNGCRFESLKTASIVFDTGTTNNRITHCYGITNRGSGPIKDDGTNIFDVGKPFYAGADLFGIYQGINITTSPGGGPAQYPIFGAPHHSDRTKLASAVGEVGIGVFRSDRQDYPGVWMDAPTNRLYIGSGLGGMYQFVSGSTNNWDLIVSAVGASASMGGVVMGGRYNEGHLTLRANSKDYHFWIDSSGNLRAGATAVNGKPGSNTAGNVVAATIPDI